MLFHSLLLVAALHGAGYDSSVQNFNQWFGYWGDHQIAQSRFALHFDAHVRRSHFLTESQQYLLRPGVDFQITPRVQLHSAFSWLPTFAYGAAPGAPQTERRWWNQAIVATRTGRINWSNRTRLEHRWLSRRYVDGDSGPANRIFEQRLRHAVRATFPVNPAWSWSLGNEVFFPIPPESHPALIDQHRIQFTVARQLNRSMRVEWFYMYQNIWQRNGRIREDNHTFGIAFFNTTPLWNIFKPRG